MLIYVAIICGLFCWLLTSFGSSLVFFAKHEDSLIFTFLNYFAVGIMLGSALFSLLIPIFKSVETSGIFWLLPIGGFLAGGLAVSSLKLLPEKFNFKFGLAIGITMHNIPEGLCVGIAVGAVALSANDFSFLSAILLAVSIGIQNIPEGLAVSLPIAQKRSNLEGFIFGTTTGIVEPIFCVIGFCLTNILADITSFFLAFAASSMIIVAVFEILDNKINLNSKKTEFLCSLSLVIGFLVSMVLAMF